MKTLLVKGVLFEDEVKDFGNLAVKKDKYSQYFLSEKLESITLPALTYTIWKENENKLIKAINEFKNTYSGLIITSERAIKVLGHVFQSEQNIQKLDVLSMPVYVVGHTTKACAEALHFNNCRGEETGNAQTLADYIIENHSQKKKPLLFLCGDKYLNVLPDKLKKCDFPFELMIVYCTKESELLTDIIEKTLATESITHLVLFSPSGIQATLPALQNIQNSPIKIGAIGKTTAKSLEEADLKVDFIAKKPTPKDLYESILKTMEPPI